MIRWVFAALAATAMIGTPSTATAVDDIAGRVTLSIEPAGASVVLGESTDLLITVSNVSDVASPPLVIHLDITDPTQTSSVDPEDWTATLSQSVGVLAAGSSVDAAWNLQPISGGTFAVYAVALSAGIDDVASSNVVQVEVADQRSLNPNGILPVSVGAPAIIGLLLVVQIRSARRVRHATT